jgi:hypothetical protein
MRRVRSSGVRAVGVAGRTAAAAAACALGFFGIAGCKARPPAEGVIAPAEFDPGPVVRQTDVGLEVYTWLTEASEEDLGRALREFPPAPVQPELVELWRQYGLRIIAVPVDRLSPLSGRLRISRSTQRQWLGQATTWTEVVSSPSLSRPTTIALDAERLRLPPGRLRLLTRSWLVPVSPESPRDARTDDQAPDAALTIELVPQHREDRALAERTGLTLEMPTLDPADEGQVFTRLLARMTVRAGGAFVIVSERPGVDWTAGSTPASEQDRAVAGGATSTRAEQPGVQPAEPAPAPKLGEVVRGKAFAPGAGATASARSAPDAAEDGAEPAQDVGPAIPTVPTLGEMLMPARPQRGVLVLVPRVPERYRLLGN